MKAAIYHGIENVTIEEIPMPECGPKDVILKTVKAGICGTDIGLIITAEKQQVFFLKINLVMKWQVLFTKLERMFHLILKKG